MPIIQASQRSAPRIRTGLYSLDWAARQDARVDRAKNLVEPDYGIPTRGVYEIYGDSTTGKSTLAYYLSGVVAGLGEEDKDIHLGDVEGGLDLGYLPFAFGASGWDGLVTVADRIEIKNKREVARPHEDIAMEVANSFANPMIGAAIFDSVSMFTPIAEMGGNIGDAIMGRRAKAMAQMLRRAVANIEVNEHPAVLFVVNHKYENLGTPGHTTAGGKALQNVPIVRMWVKRLFKGDFGDDSDHFRAEIQMMKLRKGGKGKKARVAFIAGYGVHPGVTAMLDCTDLGIMSNKGGWLKDLDGNKFGRTTEHIAAAEQGVPGSDERFQPFYDALQKYEDQDMRKEWIDEFVQEGK